MTAFDVNLNIGKVSLASPTSEDVDGGAPAAVQVSLDLAMLLPLDGGGGQPVAASPGAVRFSLGRDEAIEVGRRLMEEGEKLPSRPTLEVAQSMAGVDKQADFIAGLRQ